MYFCIDMKCFFASVECAERGLNPLTTPLVVADGSRGQGALCLAVSPFLKQRGVKNRGRLFEIPKECSYFIAKPRMKKYIEYAVLIHRIFLKYVDSSDIHTYSVDEAFLHVKEYYSVYGSIQAMALTILEDIRLTLGIIATCGAGDNLYLAKLSLDIFAKKQKNNYHYLSLKEYYATLWESKDLTSIWQIGKGIAQRLHKLNIHTLHELALADPNLLKKEFGVIGLDLYEHAWGKDTTTIQDIKSYQPISKSFSRNQILFRDYTKEEAWVPLVEMLFLLCMDLSRKKIMARNISFYIGYSKHIDSYHKSFTLDCFTDDFFKLKNELKVKYEVIADKPIRQLGISLHNFIEKEKGNNTLFYQPNIKYENLSDVITSVWQKYGKNKLVIGTALEKESTLYERNKKIGGHNSE